MLWIIHALLGRTCRTFTTSLLRLVNCLTNPGILLQGGESLRSERIEVHRAELEQIKTAEEEVEHARRSRAVTLIQARHRGNMGRKAIEVPPPPGFLHHAVHLIGDVEGCADMILNLRRRCLTRRSTKRFGRLRRLFTSVTRCLLRLNDRAQQI